MDFFFVFLSLHLPILTRPLTLQESRQMVSHYTASRNHWSGCHTPPHYHSPHIPCQVHSLLCPGFPADSQNLLPHCMPYHSPLSDLTTLPEEP